MQFKHPEILYALFLLLIPIFIHLFQLRRFQKMPFTNVAFLKKLTIQTRKSSQLKRWLTLLTRMLALACLVFAFAQAFFPAKNDASLPQENIIYIDNSFSMQATGTRGPLLERALQDLFEQSNAETNISWFTNNSEKKNTSIQDFKNEVLTIDYSQNQLAPSQVILKAKQLFSTGQESQKRLIYISDFQTKEAFPEVPQDILIDAVQLKPVKTSNIAIDSVYITSKNNATIQLEVNLSKTGEDIAQATVSLFNKEKLIAKTAVDLSEKSSNNAVFDIENTADFVGRLEVNDPNLVFDNALFFSINSQSKIKVLSINQADDNFLTRIFNKEEFQFMSQAFDNLNYNDIPDQNLIILNELEVIPSSLATALKSFQDAGGNLAIIPNTKADLRSYNAFLNTINMGALGEVLPQEKKISQITFSHPLFKDVFEKEVVNFQYPKVNSYYNTSTNASVALRFEDAKAFLLQKNNSYLFTAAINNENSNFQSSPLVVPSLYNMALHSLPLPRLYYTIGEENSIAVPAELGSNEILSIRDSVSNFIPRQQTKDKYVLIYTIDEPENAGNYQITNKEEVLENISYNFSRAESDLSYLQIKDWDGVEVHKSIASLFEYITEANSVEALWKWFVIFALIFLMIEMLLLKYLK